MGFENRILFAKRPSILGSLLIVAAAWEEREGFIGRKEVEAEARGKMAQYVRKEHSDMEHPFAPTEDLHDFLYREQKAC